MKYISTFVFMVYGFFTVSLRAQTALISKELDFQFDSKTELTSGWDYLCKEASKARLFIGGENHREVSFNSIAEYGFMNRLHKFSGYRHYVVELSPSRAHYLNRYIRYSDTHARDALKGITSPKYMNLFENLHRWNQQLDTQDRIWVHGIDVERFYDLSLERMAEVFRNHANRSGLPDSIRAVVYAVVSYANRDFTDRLNQFKQAASDGKLEALDASDGKTLSYTWDYELDFQQVVTTLRGAHPQMLEWIGAEAVLDYEMSLVGLEEYVRWEKELESASRFHWRERTMYERLVAALRAHPEGKFFGQFGRCHISESVSDNDCGWFAFSSVVHRITSHYFKHPDSVITMGYFYSDRSQDVSAADYTRQEFIQKELQLVLKPFQAGVRYFDLNDTMNKMPELRKKFRFVLINHLKEHELDHVNDEGSEGQEEERSAPQWGLYQFNHALNFWNRDFTSLNRHFESGRGALNPPKILWGLQHDLTLNKGLWVLGISGYYTYSDDQNPRQSYYQDTQGMLFYGHWGLDLLAGVQKNVGRWSGSILGRVGVSESYLHYFEQTKDPLSVSDVNGLRIHNRSWNVGGLGSIHYLLLEHLGLGLQGSIYQNVGHGYWVYTGSNQPYASLGVASGLTAWALSLQVCVFFSK